MSELFRAPALRGIPMIVETDDATHAADIATLKALRSSAADKGRVAGAH